MKNDDENAREKKNDQNAICANYYSLRLTREKKKCDLYTRAFTDITHIDSQSGTQKVFQNGTELKCLRKMRLTSL